MTFFKNIIRSGLSDTDIYQKKRGIIFSNYICLILCTAIFLVFIIKYLFFKDLIYGFNVFFLLLGLILFLVPILLNRLFITNLSRLFLCYAPVVFLWVIYISQLNEMDVIETSIYDSLRIYLLAVSMIPYFLFDKNRLSYLILGVMPTLVSFIFFEYFMNLAGLSIHHKGLPGDDYQLMQMRTLIAYLIINGGCFGFQTIITRNDEVNQKLLAELNHKTDEIKVQNQKLLQSQSRLHEMNQNLEALVEKKTEDIKRRNEILINYSYMNAHQVRGPLARALGLIYLSKKEIDINYPWFFNKVEQEINEIDDIVKRIAKDLDDSDLGGMDGANPD